MKSLLRIGAITGLALGVSACGTLYKLDVTAYSNPKAELGKTYVLLSGSSDLDVNSAEFETYAAQVEYMLEPKGYERLPGDSLTEAALGIYLAAGVSDPSKEFHTVATPIYERPYAENTTAVVRSSGGSTSGGQQGQQQPVVTPPPEILTGYEKAGFATTVYTKYLNIVAVDLQDFLADIAQVGRNEAVPTEIWSIDVETTGQPADLKEVLPVMLAASQPYVGTSTDDVVRVKMSATNKRVSDIKHAD